MSPAPRVSPDRPPRRRALQSPPPWPVFYAFDLLQLGDGDLRCQPLRPRKRELRRLIPRGGHWRLRYLDHVRERGRALYAAACQRDTEGVVAKWAGGPYHTDGTKTSWVQIKNPTYTQAEGRHEFFEGRAESRPRWKPAAYRMDPRAAAAW